MSRIAVFPGSFAPFTVGHKDIADRALALVDKLVIAVGYNEHKTVAEDVQQRVTEIERLYAGNPAIEVVSYTGLTVDLVRRVGACAIVRGLRNAADLEYEKPMADINRQLAGVDTIFLFCRPEYESVSGSMIRELQHNGVDVSRWLPE